MVNDMIITAIKPQRRGNKRASLFIDGKFALGVSSTVLQEAGIHAGLSVSQSEVDNLKKAEQGQHAMNRALQYLSYRPRSEYEVKNRLQRYGYEDDIIATTLDRLRNSGYVDDVAFTTFWKENRSSFSSRSTRLIAQELKQKGIDSETIAETIEDINDEAEAYRAGQKKAHSLSTMEKYEFRRKLGAFLRRRGFDYEVISPVVNRLWNEQNSEDKKWI